jgi:hypothetical protein
MSAAATQALAGVGYELERRWRDEKLCEVGADNSEVRGLLVGRETETVQTSPES